MSILPRATISSILPGFSFAIAVALAAKGLSWAAGGAVSAILCAVVLGALWRNLVGVGPRAEPGLAFAGETLLRTGIALVGLRLTWSAVADVAVAGQIAAAPFSRAVKESGCLSVRRFEVRRDRPSRPSRAIAEIHPVRQWSTSAQRP